LGRIQNGVGVFNDILSLPDGTEVMVVIGSDLVIRRALDRKLVELPLVFSKAPGIAPLTNEMIGQILNDDEDTP
jgi:hypothetical protein